MSSDRPDSGRLLRRMPCLYDVTISHRRVAPVANSFRYRSYMWCYELGAPPDLPRVLRPLARFDPADHLDVPSLLRAAGIEAHRTLVLTNGRVLGYVFNPISVYWSYDRAGRLSGRVAEVHNTYGERHAYVLPPDEETAGTVTFDKTMQVSPFHPEGGAYRMRLSEPGDTVSVSIVLDRPGGAPFSAGLAGRRVEPTRTNLLLRSLRYPAAPLRGRALIQWQGIKLWAKGVDMQPRGVAGEKVG